MEKTLNARPTSEKVKADLVLEINADHKIADSVKALAGDEEKLKDYAVILYDMARMISGLSIEDPAKLSELVCGLM
jgi:molecular chaperone HtpG